MHNEAGQRWNVLYTKPHREATVCWWLSQRGMRVYFPEVRSHRGQRAGRMTPFFPCYVFARLDLAHSDLTTIGWTPGLRRVVAFDGILATVSEEFIQFLEERVDEINAHGWSPFRPGDTVLITEGPFKDMVAIFSRPCSAARRVQVLLDILGRETRCEVDIDWLKKISSPR